MTPKNPTLRPRRSALYVPGDKPRALDKARQLDCDVVIIDLEDAVAPEAKAAARDSAVEALRAGGFGRREVILRVNALSTPWGTDDLRAVNAARPDTVLLPKVSSAQALTDYTALIEQTLPVWAMIETCLSVLHVHEIAQMRSQCSLTGFVMGTNDLAKELRCKLDARRDALTTALCATVLAGRAYDLVILDGVYNDVDDAAGLQLQCEQGAGFGFDGKTLIHPAQLEAANRAFSPAPEEIQRSRAIVQAFDDPSNASKGVLKVEGRMVERLHLEMARRVLAIAEHIVART